jgi:hypothetical protein
MWTDLLEIIGVDLDILNQLMIRYSIFARYFGTNWNAVRQYIIYKKYCDFLYLLHGAESFLRS